MNSARKRPVGYEQKLVSNLRERFKQFGYGDGTQPSLSEGQSIPAASRPA
jgi:hypothetical protein